MSQPAPTFRLLDGRVGWDARPGDGLAGVTLVGGTLRLAPRTGTQASAGAPSASRSSDERPALVRSQDGAWWLAGQRGLWRLGLGDLQFRLWRRAPGIRDIVVRGRRLALVMASGGIEVFDIPSRRLLAYATVPEAILAELDGSGGLLVTDRWGRRTKLDPSGLICWADPPCQPGDSVPPQLGARRSWPADVVSGDHGFTLPGRGSYDWQGQPLPTQDLGRAGVPEIWRGQFLSMPLDSGVPGCRWHRIRIDAEVPEGTAFEVAFATTDGSPQGRIPAPATAGPWSDFPTGDPHPDDWFRVRAGVLDSVLSAAAGRYGYIRLRLTGSEGATPVIHQVRLDLPRATSLDQLPAVYAEDPQARDFIERFLSVFDAQLEQIDEVLARRSALLDADALPDDALGWLAGLLGTGFEAEMPVANRRRLLCAAPDLFRRRGTPQGLVDTLEIALGASCTVEELGTARPWGAVDHAHLGSIRLFSRSVARVRLGTSRLGIARLEGRGNPDLDAVLAGAHRIRVHVPSGTDTALVARVVRSQIPAHVVFRVEAATPGFVAGTVRLGIDTVLSSPASAVVGDAVLGRRGMVSAGLAAGSALLVGRSVATGLRGSEEGKGMECTC
jgi:phage tail-like protein